MVAIREVQKPGSYSSRRQRDHARKLAVQARFVAGLVGPGIICDSFAGGGGASEAIEQALGVPVDEALNHDPEALCMHLANHPWARHWCNDIREIDPRNVAAGRRVRFKWGSPDCKHFSKAKGAALVDKAIRSLAWILCRWAKRVRPDVIMLENVEEFVTWGPVKNGKPIKERRGETFRQWVAQLEAWGYKVEWRELRASDYGAPTIRKRLFVVARCDGQPIVWPKPSHGPRLRPVRQAAEIIDWSIPCPSIFNRSKPLKPNTLRRIAKGIFKYVLEAGDPFLISITHTGSERIHSVHDPLNTITCANRGELALISPFYVPRYGERPGQEPRCLDPRKPLPTIVPTANGAQLVAAFLAQHNTGEVGSKATAPVSTICSTGSHQAVVTSHLVKLRNNCYGQDLREPCPTITAGGWHIGEVRAFLLAYYGTDQDTQMGKPLPTCTTRHRFGLVTILGVEWQIVDIGMRMLTARELFSAQGFPDWYKIDPLYSGLTKKGKPKKPAPLSKTAQVRCCGNSVSPPPAVALIRANCA